MVTTERLETQLQSVDAWTDANLGLITRELEKERLRLLHKRKRAGSGATRNLDRRHRWISEMPLCEFWKNMNPPKGFRMEYAEIYIRPQEERSHFFAQSNDNLVICFTPGQFVNSREEELRPGDRIKILEEKAPDLIKIYGDGLARLYGRRDGIWKRLGLSYS